MTSIAASYERLAAHPEQREADDPEKAGPAVPSFSIDEWGLAIHVLESIHENYCRHRARSRSASNSQLKPGYLYVGSLFGVPVALAS